jgi:GNAT superfamily N-acetyltransferase
MSEPVVRIDYYGPEDALRLRRQILDVYLASHHDQQHNPWFGPDQFWRRLVEAWLGETMAGYAFGSPIANSADTWKMAVQAIPELLTPKKFVPIYIFREFAVHPSHQGHGYGHMIHNALLNTRPEPLARLLVRTDNPAKATYLHWGWHVAGKVQPFEDAPTFDVMVRILPLSLRPRRVLRHGL